MNLRISLLEETYAIYRFKPGENLPKWIYLSDFYSITGTNEELSVVTEQIAIHPEVSEVSKDWRILKIIGPLDFSLVGILADISAILKNKHISIFVISSYDTDYIMVQQKDLDKAILALEQNYNRIIRNT